MTDGATTKQVMVEFPPRLQTGMLANCKAIATAALAAGNKDTIVIGYIMGVARGITVRNNPNDDTAPSYGLTGVFEGMPVDATRPRLRSGVCFLPPATQQQIVGIVAAGQELPKENPKRGKRQDVLGAEYQFAFEIGIRANDSSVGYEYAVRGMIEVEDVDPLQQMKQALLPKGTTAPALAAPKTDTDTKAPAKTKARAKK